MELPIDEHAAILSANIRRLRSERGLTQVQLAELSGLPRSTIAHLEAGAANPTLSVLTGLASAFGESLQALVSGVVKNCTVYPQGSLPTVVKGGKAKSKLSSLLPIDSSTLSFARIELAVNATTPVESHAPGTVEHVFCERGQLELEVGGEKFRVEAGGVANFRADEPHRYRNIGALPVLLFSLVSLPPR